MPSPEPDLVGDLVKLFHLNYADAVKVVDRGFGLDQMVKYVHKLDEAQNNPKIAKPAFLVRKWILDDFLTEGKTRAEASTTTSSAKQKIIDRLNAKALQEDRHCSSKDKNGNVWQLFHGVMIKGPRVGPTSVARPLSVMDIPELQRLEDNLIEEIVLSQDLSYRGKNLNLPEVKLLEFGKS